LRSAIKGKYPSLDRGAGNDGHQAITGWRQGYLSNITNPKVLVSYLAVLPQFLGSGAGIGTLLIYAVSHALLSLMYLLSLVTVLHRARRWFARRTVRWAMDATTGAVLLGFGAKLAAEQA
jgi:threonine/homoserine/homoserine lactone efflux protein